MDLTNNMVYTYRIRAKALLVKLLEISQASASCKLKEFMTHCGSQPATSGCATESQAYSKAED